MAVWVALCLCTLSFPISALLCGTGSDYCGLCGLGSLQADFQLGSDTESYWQETFPGGSAGKESTCNAGDPGSIPGSGRSAGKGIGYPLQYSWASPCGSAGRESTRNAGDLGSIPGLGRSPGEGKGYPFQYSDLEKSMDCIVHGLPKSQT